MTNRLSARLTDYVTSVVDGGGLTEDIALEGAEVYHAPISPEGGALAVNGF